MSVNPRLNRLHPSNWKKDLYLCNKLENIENDYGENIPNFSVAIPLLGRNGINYQSIKERTDIEMFGENSTGVIKAVIQRHEHAYNLFNEDSKGGVVYLNEASPFIQPNWSTLPSESYIGEWANYQVNAVRIYNLTKHVYFVKIKTTGT